MSDHDLCRGARVEKDLYVN